MSEQELFDEETREALRQIFASFKKSLRDVLVIDRSSSTGSEHHEHTHVHHHGHHHHGEGCPTCHEAEALAKALMEISEGRLVFEIVDKDSELAKTLKTRYVPAFIYDSPYKNVRYYGLPSGQEFAPFIYVHQYIANNEIKLPQEVIDEVKKIDMPLHVKIFVTPECPYCPLTVDALNQMALVNNNLLVETIEALELPMEADIYGVAYVPDVVITDPDEQLKYGAEPVERISGYMPPEEMVKILIYASEKMKEIKRK